MKSTKLAIASLTTIFVSLTVAWLLVMGPIGNADANDKPSSKPTVGETIDDSTITARVKASFAKDKEVSAVAISVETLRGEVQLSGFAKTAKEKAKAETIARETPGVKSVHNDILVRP